jgi:hypothetical protein
MPFLWSVRELAEERPAERQTSPVRDLWVDVSRLRIHCLKAGRQGRLVLLLHGGGLDAAGLSHPSNDRICSIESSVVSCGVPAVFSSLAFLIGHSNQAFLIWPAIS